VGVSGGCFMKGTAVIRSNVFVKCHIVVFIQLLVIIKQTVQDTFNSIAATTNCPYRTCLSISHSLM